MRVEEFRDAVKREFGANLEHATPANVREFLDRLSADAFAEGFHGRIELNEPKATYDEIFRDFFVRVLDMEHDEAMILLWTMAFELTFAEVEHHFEDRFRILFGDHE